MCLIYSDFIMYHFYHGMWIIHKDDENLSLLSCVRGWGIFLCSIPVHSMFYTLPIFCIVWDFWIIVNVQKTGSPIFSACRQSDSRKYLFKFSLWCHVLNNGDNFQAVPCTVISRIHVNICSMLAYDVWLFVCKIWEARHLDEPDVWPVI